MRNDAIQLEDGRLEGLDYDTYPWFHERHRIFPDVFRDKNPRKILDIAAGMGLVGKRIAENYDAELLCNEVSPRCLRSLNRLRLPTTSFDLDNPQEPFPIENETFDAIISLATFEHIINLDHHMQEIRRILKDDGHLFISTPNYSGLHFFIRYLWKGESFHDPLSVGLDRYEFYAHVRYFMYKTLLRFVSSFGFRPVEVYVPLPHSSTRFRALQQRTPLGAWSFRMVMRFLGTMLSPRWALHPVLCFAKAPHLQAGVMPRPRKILI